MKPSYTGEIMDMRSIAAFTLLAMTLQFSAIAQQKAPITVTISTPTPVVKSGAPIRIDVSVLNASDQPVRILKALGSDGQAEFVNRVQVYDAHGKPLPHATGRHSAISRKTIPLEPGKSANDFLMLTGLYDLLNPGLYRVVVRHEFAQPNAPQADARRLFVESNTLAITVTN